VLVGIADEPAPEVVQLPPPETAEIDAEHIDPSGGRSIEAGEDAQHRRLPGAARSEDDDNLPLAHREGEALESG
jgi:hypothetical protein